MPVAWLLAVVLLINATDARAADGVHPAPSSPAGTEYAIPLDAARQDAAPRFAHPAPRDATGADDAPDDATLVQSENGYGSSAVVPGAPSWDASPTAAQPRRQGVRPAGDAAVATPATATSAAPVRAAAPAATGAQHEVLVAAVALLLTAAIGTFAGVMAAGRVRRRPAAQ